MKLRSLVFILFLLVVGIIITGVAIGQEGQGPEPESPSVADVATIFTYQGQLKSGSAGVNGKCDFQFELYNVATGGAKIGSTLTRSNVDVVDGRFTVTLDFGASAFPGNNRWLQIKVRCPAGSGSYTGLSPRQHLTAVPYAMYANNAGTLDGLDSSAFSRISHDHMVKQVSQNFGVIVNTDFDAQTEVLQLTIDIPDKCSGSSPIDQWDILVTANGSVYNTLSSVSYALWGLSIDNATNYLSNTETIATVQGPGSTSADFTQSVNTTYLFTDVDSGSHVIRWLAFEDGGNNQYAFWYPRLVAQALGYTCASSVSEVAAEDDQSNSNEEIVDPSDFNLLRSDN